MMDFQKKAMGIWLKAFDQWAALGKVPYHREAAASVIAAALEQTYREGVEAMRDATMALEGSMRRMRDALRFGYIHGESTDSLLAEADALLTPAPSARGEAGGSAEDGT